MALLADLGLLGGGGGRVLWDLSDPVLDQPVAPELQARAWMQKLPPSQSSKAVQIQTYPFHPPLLPQPGAAAPPSG